MTDTLELSRRIAELCVRIPASAGPAALCRELTKLAPGLAFREVLTRGGWYRLGGVVDAGGSHLADDLEAWATAELAARDEDLQRLCDDYAVRELYATRLNGKTHYLVATVGDGATDFLQLEIEELQETRGHALFAVDTVPASLDELIDAPPGGDAPLALGTSFLALRRLAHVGDFLARMRAQKPAPQPIHRFIAAWEASSAGAATQFANHWVIGLREHQDRFRQMQLQATPIAAINGAPPAFAGAFGARGLALQAALGQYDKAAGYPLAWFFHMLTLKSVPHAVAGAVMDDLQSGFRYLAERDAQVLKDWLYAPYGF